jgi:DNA-binding NarL/FixJ family response regulator
MGHRAMHVLIADDHTLIRQALISLLMQSWPSWIFGQAGSLLAVRERLDADTVALLIIDLDMPGMDGSASLRRLRQDYPSVKIAVLTSTDDKSTILGCLGAGVHGYFLKADASQQLLLAVQTILAGGVYLPASLSEVGAEQSAAAPVPNQQPVPPATVPQLTTRQREVMVLVAQGRSTKEIARILDLGIGTVKVHLSAAYRALGAQNRVDAVVKSSALP